MDITILCVLFGVIRYILISMALFVGVALIIYWLAVINQRMERKHREYVKELRRNKVYDNYLTRFERRG